MDKKSDIILWNRSAGSKTALYFIQCCKNYKSVKSEQAGHPDLDIDFVFCNFITQSFIAELQHLSSPSNMSSVT